MTQNSINNSASILDVDNIRLDGNTISSTDTNGNIVLAPDGSGVVSVTAAAIVPSGDRADSLGSATNSWDNVYADGISFNDGTDILANYSFGTFTPGVAFGGGTTGITYATQTGSYTRIGRICYYAAIVTLSNKGSSNGNATLTGLPFTVASIGTNYEAPTIFTNTATVTNYTEFLLRIDAGGTTGTFWCQGGSPGTSTNLTDAEFTNSSSIDTSGWFVIS